MVMAARYKAKAWLHGLAPEPFNRFVDFIGRRSSEGEIVSNTKMVYFWMI
jgi:hypothetical protein